MSWIQGTFYCEFSKVKNTKLFARYLDFDKRPRFADEVEEDEVTLQERAEFLPYPSWKKKNGSKGVFFTLDLYQDMNEILDVFAQLSQYYQAEKLLVCIQSDEEHVDYVTWDFDKKRYTKLYTAFNPRFPKSDEKLDAELAELEFDYRALMLVDEKFS